jgi:hypothetical protein
LLLQVRYFEVSEDELVDLRSKFQYGQYMPLVSEVKFWHPMDANQC